MVGGICNRGRYNHVQSSDAKRAVVTGALNRTRGTDTQVYVRSAVDCRKGGHDGAENVPAEDRRGMVE
jgi:hypothetical protein